MLVDQLGGCARRFDAHGFGKQVRHRRIFPYDRQAVTSIHGERDGRPVPSSLGSPRRARSPAMSARTPTVRSCRVASCSSPAPRSPSRSGREASSTCSSSSDASSTGCGAKAPSPSSSRRWEATAAPPPRANARCWRRTASTSSDLGCPVRSSMDVVAAAGGGRRDDGRDRRRGVEGVGHDRREPGEAAHRLPRPVRERADEDDRDRPRQPGAGRAHPRLRHARAAHAHAPRSAPQVLAHGNVVLGVAIVENALEQTMAVRSGSGRADPRGRAGAARARRGAHAPPPGRRPRRAARRPDGEGHQRRRHGHQRDRPHDDPRRARSRDARASG